MTDDGRSRVKLYILNADKQWDELGTGHVFSECFEALQMTCLQVKAEGNDTFLLSSPVQPDKIYRREVNTMTWFEADCVYITLHFQEEAGCDEIWEKICQVLGKDLYFPQDKDIMENPENEMFGDVSDIYSYRLEKNFTAENLEDFNTFLKTCITSPIRRETFLHLLKNVKDYCTMLIGVIHFYEEYMESGILTDDVLHAKVKNLILIRSNLVLISTLHKKANPTSQIESLLQELNL